MPAPDIQREFRSGMQQLLVPVLDMNECRSGDEAVYYRGSERDDAIHLDSFEIGQTGTQDWTNTINGLVIGDRS